MCYVLSALHEGHHRPVGIVPQAHSEAVVSNGSRKRRRNGVPPVVRQSSCNCQSSSVTAVKFVQEHAVATSGAGDGLVGVTPTLTECVAQMHIEYM